MEIFQLQKLCQEKNLLKTLSKNCDNFLIPEFRKCQIMSVFLASKIDDKIISEGIKTLASTSKSYEFLHNEEELYQVSDVKEKYQ